MFPVEICFSYNYIFFSTFFKCPVFFLSLKSRIRFSGDVGILVWGQPSDQVYLSFLASQEISHVILALDDRLDPVHLLMGDAMAVMVLISVIAVSRLEQ